MLYARCKCRSNLVCVAFCLKSAICIRNNETTWFAETVKLNLKISKVNTKNKKFTSSKCYGVKEFALSCCSFLTVREMNWTKFEKLKFNIHYLTRQVIKEACWDMLQLIKWNDNKIAKYLFSLKPNWGYTCKKNGIAQVFFLHFSSDSEINTNDGLKCRRTFSVKWLNASRTEMTDLCTGTAQTLKRVLRKLFSCTTWLSGAIYAPAHLYHVVIKHQAQISTIPKMAATSKQAKLW